MITEAIPLFEGISDATLTAYIQDSYIDGRQVVLRPAVVICPGGAYLGITEKEAEPVALRFLSAGYNAFVLRYSIGAGFARFPAPFVDAAKSIMLVRENAKKWGIDQDRIYLCGFSTGGHVASFLGATWHEEYLAKALNRENDLFRPNALLLGYPLLDMHLFKIGNLQRSPEMKPVLEMVFSAVFGTYDPKTALMDEWSYKNRITSNMPPTFLWGTAEDNLVDVNQSLDFIRALAQKGRSVEFHIFEKGAHGLSLGNEAAGYSEEEVKKLGNTGRWMDLALNWLKSKI